MAPPAVRIRDLAVDLQARPVLRGIDLDVPAGAVVGLTGHNGAGKTTLLRAILGEIPPKAGSVQLFGGTDGRAVAPDERRARRPLTARQRVAFAAQHPYPSATAVPLRTAVAFGRFARVGVGRRLDTTDWDAVDGAIERLGLADLNAAPVTELSGGQRQRVSLARALAAEPDLLLLDEPTSHLDRDAIDLVLDAIVTFEGTVLLVTHGAGLSVCDDVLRLAGGRLAA